MPPKKKKESHHLREARAGHKKMPMFAYTSTSVVVDAATPLVGSDFFCCACGHPIALARGGEGQAVFEHTTAGHSCHTTALPAATTDAASAAVLRGTVHLPPRTTEMVDSNVVARDWRSAWRALEAPARDAAKTTHEKRSLVLGQPKDHECGPCESKDAIASVCVLDATTEWFARYSYAKDEVWFCQDGFRRAYKTTSSRVLLHCADGELYQSVCDTAFDIDADGAVMRVRMLVPIDAATRLALEATLQRASAGAPVAWPPRRWVGAPRFCAPATIATPIRVLSEAGRREVDVCHRDFMHRFPTVQRTVISAPPGAGKTTAIIDMMRRWGKRALVITFNKATQETMQRRIREAGLGACHARTVDSLCFEACGGPEFMKWSDWELCNAFWPRSAKTKFGRRGGGRRASDIIDFRFRHPRGRAEICKQHRRLAVKGSDWDAQFSSYPMQKIAQGCLTHAAARYNCDRRRALREKLDSYDVVLVDEMQDLVSAQEQRLLFQTIRPVVLVGDPMQAINNFRDDPPCSLCSLEQEEPPALPRPIEWYGTWRLDAFTASFVEERFGRRMHSYRGAGEQAEIFWKDDLVFAKTLVLCRYNQNVVKTAARFPELRVVGGDSLAQRLATAAKDDSMVTPLASYAQSLVRAGRLEDVCGMLRDRAVRLVDVNGVAAVSTVHQAKGFEYDHCAVHADLLAPSTDDERNISFVAFTRHKKSLVVMAAMRKSAAAEPAEGCGTWILRRL